MRVIYHPEFPRDIKRFEAQYRGVAELLATGRQSIGRNLGLARLWKDRRGS